MFLQDPAPDTSGYMIAGYVIAFAIMGIYLTSLLLRSRNLDQDLRLLEQMQQENRPALGGSSTAPAKARPKASSPKRKAGRASSTSRKKRK